MKRIESVDTVRFLAVCSVVAHHFNPFYFSGWEQGRLFSPASVLGQIRFAVPFFFAISGYFWGTKINSGEDAFHASARMIQRIALIFAGWSAFYFFPYEDLPYVIKQGWVNPLKPMNRRLLDLASDPVRLVFEGTRGHLWFLVALMLCVAISSCFVAARRPYALAALSAVLYLLGLMAKAYANTPVGLHIPFDTRDGPFFGMLFFCWGCLLSKKTPVPGWLWQGAAMVAAGCALRFGEVYLLHAFFHRSLEEEYVLGTVLVGFGVTLVALSNPVFLRSRVLGEIGKLALGIYALQLLFVGLFKPIKTVCPAGGFLAILLLTVLSVYFMAKNKVLRYFVA